MRAIIATSFGGPDVLEIAEVQDPKPGHGQVLIEVRYASVNFADTKLRAGGYRKKKDPPFIPGLDLFGKVVEIGAGVQNISAGQRVLAFPSTGSYAEWAVADADLVFPVSDDISDEDAAALPVSGGAAFGMLTRAAKLARDERVLIHSTAGGVGSFAVQIARHLGAAFIAGTVGEEGKAEFAKELGADRVLTRNQSTYRQDISDIAGEQGFDVILNPLGGDYLISDLAALAPYGRLVNYGQMSGGESTVALRGLSSKNQSLIGFSFGTIRRTRPREVKEIMRGLLKLVSEGSIKSMVGRIFDFQHAAAAQTFLETRSSTGKILLSVTN